MFWKSDILYRSRGNCIFSFQFLLDIIWISMYLNYVPKFGPEDLSYNYLFTSQKESHSVADMGFFVKLSFVLSQLELLREEFTKLKQVF